MSQHTQCRICHTTLPAPFLDLGMMPPSNAFLAPTEIADHEVTYPLAVSACTECGLVQLNYVVPPEELYRNYLYVSSTSEAVREHARQLAARVMSGIDQPKSTLIAEIASNDGTVLKAFQTHGCRVLGIEPAHNIAELAVADGVPTVPEFFSAAMAGTLAKKHGPAAVILARHVFAHIDDVHNFFEGIAAWLDTDGVLLIEVPYWGELINRVEFDTIYHEHLSYISVEPFARLCEAHGLSLVDVEAVNLHGGSVMLHVRRDSFVGEGAHRVEAYLHAERSQRLTAPATLERFADDVRKWKVEFEGCIRALQQSGARIIGYGAAAKANTLLNWCPDVAHVLECILDRSELKHGLVTPGTHIPVHPVETWEQWDASHMLILAWNFEEEIRRQMHAFAEQGGQFIVPIPEPALIG